MFSSAHALPLGRQAAWLSWLAVSYGSIAMGMHCLIADEQSSRQMHAGMSQVSCLLDAQQDSAKPSIRKVCCSKANGCTVTIDPTLNVDAAAASAFRLLHMMCCVPVQGNVLVLWRS